MWGEETDPTLLSTIPGGYRNPLISALGVQPAETWCSNQGSWSPRCRDWGGGVALETEDLCPRFSPGDCVSSPHPHGSGSCAWGPPAALYLQCVSSSLRFPSSELRVLPWWTCGPFSYLHLSHSHEVRQLPVGSCSVFCWVRASWGVIYDHNASHI